MIGAKEQDALAKAWEDNPAFRRLDREIIRAIAKEMGITTAEVKRHIADPSEVRRISSRLHKDATMNMKDIKEKIDDLWTEHHKVFKDKLSRWLDSVERLKEATAGNHHFHQWYPLSPYISVGTKAGHFSLRFFGQEVANLVVKEKKVYLTIRKDTARNNEKHFHRHFPALEVPILKHEWRDREGRDFREFFREQAKHDLKLRSPEHAIESRFIKEMVKKSRDKFGGTLTNIQPVTISGFPLQFPLPLSGFSGTPVVSTGPGHIDILARHRVNGRVRLSVWELKAPGKECKNALRQVYIYAVTLLKMLRDRDSGLGERWYKVLGFSKPIPPALQIEGIVAISEKQKEEFEKKNAFPTLPIRIGDDSVHLWTAYYNEDTLEIELENRK